MTATTATPSTTACIRRPYAVWTTCRCPDCVVMQRKTAKLHRHAYLTAAHSKLRTMAWQVLDRWIAAAWTPTAMASASGLPVRYFDSLLQQHRRGHRQQMGPRHAEAIINHTFPTAGRMTALGTTRRLQALAALGWTLQELAAQTDLPFTTLEALRLGTVDTTRIEVVQLVARVYDRLSMTRGDSNHARLHAARHSWAPPLAWDDIDDPYEQANVDGAGHDHDPEEGQVGELAHLMAGEHWTWDGITNRLGVTKDAVYALCLRHERYDLLAKLQGTDPNFKGEAIPHRGEWPEAQLRAAHAAHSRGEASLWVLMGEREYQRLRKQRARQATDTTTATTTTATQEDAA